MWQQTDRAADRDLHRFAALQAGWCCAAAVQVLHKIAVSTAYAWLSMP